MRVRTITDGIVVGMGDTHISENKVFEVVKDGVIVATKEDWIDASNMAHRLHLLATKR